MNIEIQEAKRKLEIMEQLSNDPSLILTDLFHDVTDGCNFWRQVTINGKHLYDYAIEYLESIEVFQDCTVKPDSWLLFVYLPSLKRGKYSALQEDDCVMEINLDKRTFKQIKRAVQNYEFVLKSSYTYKEEEISDFWKKYENFNFKNRIRNAINATYRKTALPVKIADFFYVMCVPKKQIEKKVTEAKEIVESRNKLNKRVYEENVSQQNFYKEHAPEQIEKIQRKQKEISEFLLNLGYKET